MFYKTLIIILICGFVLNGVVIAKKLEQESDFQPSKRVIQAWQLGPTIPAGWQEIDKKQAKISNKNNFDVFVLMTDGKNDQIVWFEKIGRYWKMSVIESVPSVEHL